MARSVCPSAVRRSAEESRFQEVAVARMSFGRQVEELDAKVFQGRDDKGAVKEVVVLFAGGFSDKQATVAGGALEESPLVVVLGLVFGTYRIIRAEPAHVERLEHVLVDAAADFHEPTKGAFGIRRAGVQ